jgi:nicotinamidase-related amidase
MKGGLKKASTKQYAGDLSRVWNTLFKKRINDNEYLKKIGIENINFTHKDTAADRHKKEAYALFVIDMQNDFVDKEYERVYNEKLVDENNITNPSIKIGNFAVAQASTMYPGLEKKIKSALEDPLCLKIYFSRDYHPSGHMSFSHPLSSGELTTGGKYCDNENTSGCFPAHCVQCHSGSKLIPEVETILKQLNEDQASKVEIIFKGIHKECDSFTAVTKEYIDTFASNIGYKNVPSCSSVSGSYRLKSETETSIQKLEHCIDFNDKIEEIEEIDKTCTHIDFANELGDNIKNIEVCGLAGDYCVRDTVVALAETFKNKKIILLTDLTRYACLPLFTMRTLPQHVDADSATSYDWNPQPVDIPPYLMMELDSIKGITPGKSIRHYVIKEGELMDRNQLEEVKQYINGGFEMMKRFDLNHFITDEKYIIKDYSKHKNIHLQGLPEILDKATLPSYAQPTSSSDDKNNNRTGGKHRTKKQTRRTRKRRQKRSLKKRRKSRK